MIYWSSVRLAVSGLRARRFGSCYQVLHLIVLVRGNVALCGDCGIEFCQFGLAPFTCGCEFGLASYDGLVIVGVK
jgi:hypothetical protein